MKKYLFFLALLALTGCRSTTPTIIHETRTDTLYITKQQRDSIHVRDSVFAKEYMKGDTVFVQLDRWHTRYVERVQIDTLYQSRTDSVPVPYEVVKEVNHLYGWQKWLMWLGGFALLVVLAFIGFKIYRFFG